MKQREFRISSYLSLKMMVDLWRQLLRGDKGRQVCNCLGQRQNGLRMKGIRMGVGMICVGRKGGEGDHFVKGHSPWKTEPGGCSAETLVVHDVRVAGGSCCGRGQLFDVKFH